jgi:type-F conjugative transfer system protein TraW
VDGQVFEITEKDLLKEIQQKLVKLHTDGTLDDLQKQHALQAQKSIRRPKAVEGITRTKHARAWLHDPSLLIPKDIKGHQGRIIAKAGTVINPLDTVKFARPFIFLDGDDKEQIAWLKQSFKLDESTLKIILINGTPLTLSEELAMPVYFDQGGKAYPAFSYQGGACNRASARQETSRRRNPCGRKEMRDRPAIKVSREKKQEAGYRASIYRELTNERSPSSATALIITWKSIRFPSKALYPQQPYPTFLINIQSFFAKAMICFLHNIEKIRGKSFSSLQKQLILIFLFVSFFNPMAQCCPGRFVNPLTDICWSCLFPLSIGPVKVNIGGREDTPNPSGLLCFCPKPLIPLPVPGIPVGFWEPVRLVDVTRIPFCMVGLGGLSLGNTFYKHGTHSKTWDQRSGVGRSFYHVHWYIYPVIYWLELLLDFLCLESASFDVAYLTVTLFGMMMKRPLLTPTAFKD